MNSKKRNELRERIRVLEGLTAEERTALLGLLAESKPYGLVWEDKPEDVEERLRNELPVLRELPERALISPDPAAPNHILIEGDNIEALSTLAYTHEGKIDVIYIDPPYNTGNKDFVYNDSYVEKEDAYRHSKWLSFMAKRLRIAKTLMSEQGVIFISIDDNEQAQLKLLCDEVFGEGNLVANMIWKSKSGGANDAKFMAVDTESILCYAFNADKFVMGKDRGGTVTTSYNRSDENGEYALDRLDKQSIRYSDSLNYEIIGPDGKSYWPKHKDPKNPNATWRWGRDTVKEHYDELVFERGNVYTKNYKKTEIMPRNLLYDERFGRTRTGKTELFSVIGANEFNNPKPSKLISYLIGLMPDSSSTILDFFAGSGTTLHAVMQLNAEDGGHRQCILVTNNENGICEKVTYERNRRVIEGYTTPKGEVRAGLRGNTLRYYRTDFIPRSRTVKNMRQLVNLSTDMLCVKENIYREEATFGGVTTRKGVFRYFREGERQMLVVYREEVVEELAELIYDMEVAEPIIVYVFSPSEDAWSDEWDDVQEKVRPTALPAAILNTYKRVLPKRRDTPLETNQEEEGA